MASTTDDGFHEIQLNGKQLVFLFMAVVVVSVVIFLCGVLVGRGVRGDRGVLEALTTSPASRPTTDAAIPSAPPTGAPAAGNEDLSYPKRLAGSEPAQEKLRAAAPPAPAPRTAPVAPVAPGSRTEPVASASARSGPQASSGATSPKRSEGGPSAPVAPDAAGFSIQVAALRRRAEADGVVRTLTSKGYPAYVMTPEAGTPAVFRVRVGKFKERREAESVAARLEKEEQFKPWIVR